MENNANMKKLRLSLESALKFMMNGMYQKAIPLVNNSILICKKIEKERGKED